MQEHQIEGEDRWAIVELFGHQKIAGRIGNEVVGGQSFVRIDVPETPNVAAFTKLFGAGAIYAITFVSEAIATAMARGLQKEPVSIYDLPSEYADALRQVKAIASQTPDDPTQAHPFRDDDDDEL